MCLSPRHPLTRVCQQYAQEKGLRNAPIDINMTVGIARLELTNQFQFQSFIVENVTIRWSTIAEIWAAIGGLYAAAAMLVSVLFAPSTHEDEDGNPIIVFRFVSATIRQTWLQEYADSQPTDEIDETTNWFKGTDKDESTCPDNILRNGSVPQMQVIHKVECPTTLEEAQQGNKLVVKLEQELATQQKELVETRASLAAMGAKWQSKCEALKCTINSLALSLQAPTILPSLGAPHGSPRTYSQ